MKTENDLALLALGVVENLGYLRAGGRIDSRIFSALVQAFAGRLNKDRRDLISYMEWWGHLGHIGHLGVMINDPTSEMNWKKCNMSLCLSLLGSIAELEQDIAKTPTASTFPDPSPSL